MAYNEIMTYTRKNMLLREYTPPERMVQCINFPTVLP